MNPVYKPIKEKFCDIDNGEYMSFGMEITLNGEAVRRISDISMSFEFVNDLCNVCNELCVPLQQIDYIIEDCLI